MSMTQGKPAADIIDLNATRAEKVETAAANESQPALRVGEILANARKGAGLSLADIVEATKIKQAHLEAIEASDNAALPATPFTAGFIKVYGGHLDLDADALVKQFKEEVAAGAPAREVVSEPSDLLAAPAQQSYATSGNTRWASIVGVGAIALFAIWIVMQVFSRPTVSETPEPVVVEASEPLRPAIAKPDPVLVQQAPIEEEPVFSPAVDDVFDAPAIEAEATIAETAPAILANAGEEAENATTPSAPSLAARISESAEASLTDNEASLTDNEAAIASIVLDQQDVASSEIAETNSVPATAETPTLTQSASEELPSDIAAFNIASVEAAPSIVVDAPVTQESPPLQSASIDETQALPSIDDIVLPDSELDRVAAEGEGDQDVPSTAADLNLAQADLFKAPQITEVPSVPTITAARLEPKITPAQVKRRIAPVYPDNCARGATDQEQVTVSVDIGVDGRPFGISVADTSNACFNRAAMAAARRMRFDPRRVDGVATAQSGKKVTFNFAK